MYLKQIYSEIYNEPFDYFDLDKRSKLKNAVYLLEVMGLNIGDYSFSWLQDGISSLCLDGDAFYSMSNDPNEEAKFSKYAKERFEKLKEFKLQRKAYDEKTWMDCIASIHFLKNICHYNKNDIFSVLHKQKPYLNLAEENECAYNIVKEI